MMIDQSIVPADFASDKDWWRGAVIYQIYPRSYQDSNGDGIGDLKGIIERLPHIASLNVDAIWISPFFPSPMKDFGYDVTDYCDVDPIFGSMADFDQLVAAAHQLGLKVIIDLVLSHTSDQHAWFRQSRTDRTNDKADWYVWADPKPDGTPPNNWLSVFGGSAWHWNAQREQYYLHNFLVEQPDLNLHEPAVQDKLLDIARFWLKRGVDGFRLDTINFYFADKQLRDNPPLAPERRNANIAPSVNPYNHQEHVYSKNQPENIDFLKRFRALLEEFSAAVSLGEIGDAQNGLDILGQYTSGDDIIHMCYAFEFLSKEQLTAERVAEVFKRVDEVAASGWACWAFSNHDVTRHVSRWDLDPAAQRVYATMQMCFRGSVCIYQGEEFGFHEADVDFEHLKDPYGREFWPEYKGRDGCRTPMAWNHILPNGGFTTGHPWLPVDPSHLQLSADLQEEDPTAMLHHYRRLIAFRKTYPALIKGSYDRVAATGNVVHFTRTEGDASIFCAFNLSETPAELTMPSGHWTPIGTEIGCAEKIVDGTVHLGPWQSCLALRK